MQLVFQLRVCNLGEATTTLQAMAAASTSSAASTRDTLMLHAAGRCVRDATCRDAVLNLISSDHFVALGASSWDEFFRACGNSDSKCAVLEGLLQRWQKVAIPLSFFPVVLTCCESLSHAWAAAQTWTKHSGADGTAEPHLLCPRFWLWPVLNSLRCWLCPEPPTQQQAQQQQQQQPDQEQQQQARPPPPRQQPDAQLDPYREQFQRMYVVLGESVVALLPGALVAFGSSAADTDGEPATAAATANDDSVLHTARRFLVLAISECPSVHLRVRFPLLHFYHASVESAVRARFSKGLTGAMTKLDPAAVFAECQYFLSNFQFSNDQQRYNISANVVWPPQSGFDRAHPAWSVSPAEMSSAQLFFLACGCIIGKHQPVIHALAAGNSWQVEPDVVELFLAWVNMGAVAVSASVKDAALDAFAGAADQQEQDTVVRFVAATVSTLRERSLRQKWTSHVLSVLQAQGGADRGHHLQLVSTTTKSLFPAVQECVCSLAVSSFNDGVGFSRESQLIDAEKSMSVAVSLLALLPASALKQSVSKGYETILRMLHQSKAANGSTNA